MTRDQIDLEHEVFLEGIWKVKKPKSLLELEKKIRSIGLEWKKMAEARREILKKRMEQRDAIMAEARKQVELVKWISASASKEDKKKYNDTVNEIRDKYDEILDIEDAEIELLMKKQNEESEARAEYEEKTIARLQDKFDKMFTKKVEEKIEKNKRDKRERFKKAQDAQQESESYMKVIALDLRMMKKKKFIRVHGEKDLVQFGKYLWLDVSVDKNESDNYDIVKSFYMPTKVKLKK